MIVLLIQLINENVIRNNFGKKKVMDDIPVSRRTGEPFIDFKVKNIGKNTGVIVGVTKDGREEDISSTTREFAEIFVQMYKDGGYSRHEIKPVSMIPELTQQVTELLRQKFIEKPSDFEEIRQRANPITEMDLRRLAKKTNLKTYKEQDIYRQALKYPLQTVQSAPEDQIFIIQRRDGDKYLVDNTGSSSYIRFWLPIQ